MSTFTRIATVLALSLTFFAASCAGPVKAPTGTPILASAAVTAPPAPVAAVPPGSMGLYGFVGVVFAILGIASFMIIRGDKPVTM